MFVKGVSGNPGGRSKADKELVQLARDNSNEAMARILFWLRSNKPMASLKAAQIILDRGYGKAREIVQIETDEGFKGLVVSFGRPESDNRVSAEARMPLSS